MNDLATARLMSVVTVKVLRADSDRVEIYSGQLQSRSKYTFMLVSPSGKSTWVDVRGATAVEVVERFAPSQVKSI